MGKGKPRKTPESDEQAAAPPARSASQDGAAGLAITQGAPMGMAPVETQAEGTTRILLELKLMIGDVATSLETLAQRVSLGQQHTATLTTRLKEAETRVGDIEDRMAPLIRRVAELEGQMRVMHARLEDAEGRSRRNNVRVVGVPETVRPKQMESHMENLIRELLPHAKLSAHFLIERAHRAPTPIPPVGAPPRPIICRLLNYRDRDAVLAAARESGEVRNGGALLHFYPDFTLAVQKQRRTFLDAKKALRKRGLQYAMLFPARLRVIHENKTYFFGDPAKVHDFLEQLPTTPQRSTPGRIPSPGRLSGQRRTPGASPREDGRPLNPLGPVTEAIEDWVASHPPNTGHSPGARSSATASPSLLDSAG